MTISIGHPTFISCDSCSYSEESDESHFMSMIQYMKDEGWKIGKDSEGEWYHTCPSCVEDEENSMGKEPGGKAA